MSARHDQGTASVSGMEWAKGKKQGTKTEQGKAKLCRLLHSVRRVGPLEGF